MVTVRRIARDKPLPDGDWVVIEPYGEKFAASGSVEGGAVVFSPRPFNTEGAAIAAASRWAKAHGISVIHVRRGK